MKEFKERSNHYRGRGMKFKYDDLHSVLLLWSLYGGRYISLQHDLSKTRKEYKRNYSDVPLPILQASIKFFRERYEKEKRKVLERIYSTDTEG